MVWGAVVGAGVSLVGGAVGAYGARSAARAERKRQRSIGRAYDRFYARNKDRSEVMTMSMNAASKQFRDVNAEFTFALNTYDDQVAAQEKAQQKMLESVGQVMEGQPEAKGIDEEHIQSIQDAPGGFEGQMAEAGTQAGVEGMAEHRQQAEGERAQSLDELGQQVGRQQQDYQIGQAMSERDLQMALQPLQTQQNDEGDAAMLAGATLQAIGPILGSMDSNPTAKGD